MTGSAVALLASSAVIVAAWLAIVRRKIARDLKVVAEYEAAA